MTNTLIRDGKAVAIMSDEFAKKFHGVERMHAVALIHPEVNPILLIGELTEENVRKTLLSFFEGSKEVEFESFGECEIEAIVDGYYFTFDALFLTPYFV